MLHRVAVIFVAASVWFATETDGQDTCSAGNGANATAFCTALRLENGHPTTDPQQTVLSPSSAFSQRARLTPVDARRQIVKDLEAVFRGLPPLMWYGLADDEVQKYADSQLTDAQTNELRSFPGSWNDFLAKYRAWQAANPLRRNEGELLSTFMAAAQQDPQWGSLVYDDAAGPPFPVDAGAGTIRLSVADPIDWTSPEYQISIGPTFAGRIDSNDIRTILRPFAGTLWRPAAMRERLTDILQARGLTAGVEMSPAYQPMKAITLRPVERIARVLFSPPSMNTTDLERALYLLLPAGQFRTFLANEGAVVKTVVGPLPVQQVDFLDLGVMPGDEPVLISSTFQIQRLELAPLGLTLDVIPSAARPGAVVPYVDLRVEKTSSAPVSDETRRAPPPTPRREEGVLRTDPDVGVPAGAPVSQTTSAHLPPPKDLKNFLGTGFEYRPGQGVRPIGQYRRSRLFGPGGLTVEAGGANDNPIGSANVFLDFVGFPRLARRLTVQMVYASDYAVRRRFNEETVDERRVSATGRADLELMRNYRGRRVIVSVEARRTEVTLVTEATGTADLMTFDVGLSYLVDRTDRPYPYRLRVEPLVRFGHAGSTFTRYGAAATYHQLTLGSVEFDVSATIGRTGAETPVYEWLSFGGPETVRGFRQDDAVARSVWSLQPEVWLRPPGTAGATAGPGLFLRRNVRVALFADVGAVYSTLGPFEGVKAGPGIGVRITQGPAVIELDWAKSFGSAVTTANWGRFYFNLTMARGF